MARGEGPSDAFIGQTAARYLFQKRNIKVLALTYMNNDYGKGLASSFRDEFKKLGGKITADLEHNEKASSFRSSSRPSVRSPRSWVFTSPSRVPARTACAPSFSSSTTPELPAAASALPHSPTRA